jgi:hypothetical protein
VAIARKIRRKRFVTRSLFLLLALGQWISAESGRVGTIEFFGYKGLDIDRLRSHLPIRPGDRYDNDLTLRLRKAVFDAIGREPTDVAAICCDRNGNRLLYIGLPGASFRKFAYLPQPVGQERLPSELVRLYARLDSALEAAVSRGNGGEDDSAGYAIAADPTAKSLQLSVRAWALQHNEELLRVLRDSAFVEDRRIASDAIGYARQTPTQISALLRAARDPDGEVRNNATRALGVLARSKPSLAARMAPDTFIALMSSGLWRDRNKAALLLASLTATRNAALLAKIRTESVDAVTEMARWQEAGHAYFARLILGRLRGIPEEQLQKIAWNGPLEGIVPNENE